MDDRPVDLRAPQFVATAVCKFEKTGTPATYPTVKPGHLDDDKYPVLDGFTEEGIKRMSSGSRQYVHAVSGVMTVYLDRDVPDDKKNVRILNKVDSANTSSKGWYTVQIVPASA